MAKIVTAPNSVLSIPADKFPIKKGPNQALEKLLNDMEEALVSASDPKGVGLAAPQIGVSYSIYIAKPSEKSKIQVFINPKLLNQGELLEPKASKSKKRRASNAPKKLEGCLSLPNIWGEVRRSEEATINYFDEKGIEHTKKLKGFMAVIAQHEIDHLNGILFPRRVLEQKGRLYESKKDEKGEDIFEPLKI